MKLNSHSMLISTLAAALAVPLALTPAHAARHRAHSGGASKKAPASKPSKLKMGMKCPAPEFKVAPGDTLATLVTDKGTIVLELYTKDTPVTAGNFVKLAKKGFYNGQTFHRVEPHFVIQAGDPNSKNPKDPNAMLKMGTGGPGYTIKMEPSALKYKHDPGVIAMARTSDPDSAGSQFYITIGDAHFLDGKYAVFGKVLKGMDVAQNIKQWDKIKEVAIAK
jgi:peptidyl-prolyl cis-trans isomerase B (cyclophilin B)